MRVWGLAVILALAGCRGLGVKDEAAAELEQSFKASDRQVKESKTLSGLVEMETALAGYVRDEGRIPDRIEQLIPKYLAEIPAADTAVKGHGESSEVQIYPETVLRGGAIDGTRLKDTGTWGYVHNDHQVVIFVDCTHPSSRGRPWYQERGQ